MPLYILLSVSAICELIFTFRWFSPSVSLCDFQFNSFPNTKGLKTPYTSRTMELWRGRVVAALWFVLFGCILSSEAQGDCQNDCAERDPELLKSIRELTQTVKSVQSTFVSQREEMEKMTKQFQDCEMCKPQRNTGCRASPPPCFHSVPCREDSQGRVQCGPCPAGYTGNGRECSQVTTCRDRPCYQGVQCYDTDAGYQCGPCPSGFHGDGQQCEFYGTTEANTRPPRPFSNRQESYSHHQSSTNSLSDYQSKGTHRGHSTNPEGRHVISPSASSSQASGFLTDYYRLHNW